MNNRKLPTLLLLAVCLVQIGAAQTRSSSRPLVAGDLDTSGAITSSATLTLGSTVACIDGRTGALVSCGSTIRQHKLVTRDQVDAAARMIKASEIAPTEYQRVAMSIGLNPSPVLDEAELLSAIKDLGLKVYDYEKVDDFLYSKAKKQSANTEWVWKPLRDDDVKMILAEGSRWHDHVGLMSATQYQHAVPIRVLRNVQALLEKMPGAKFFVSDYEVIKPDPFLAVTTAKLLPANKVFIIDVWDEPGFEEVTKTALVASAR